MVLSMTPSGEWVMTDETTGERIPFCSDGKGIDEEHLSGPTY